MAWILIIAVISTNGVAVTQVPMASESNCRFYETYYNSKTDVRRFEVRAEQLTTYTAQCIKKY